MARTPLNTRPVNAPEPDAATQNLFDEIDQEVKAKQMTDFFKRFGGAIAGVLIAVVLGTAIASTMNNMRAAQREKDSEALIGLMDKEYENISPDEVKARVAAYDDVAKKAAGDGQKMLAGFAAAATLLHNGQQEEGLKKLDEVRNNDSFRPVYRDYALLMKVRAQMDNGDAAKLQDDLKPLLDSNNAWYLSALETSAILFAKQGKMDEAVNQLRGITDTQDAPVAARERALQLTRLYSAK